MNLLHQRICRSDRWAGVMRSQVLPWACSGLRLDGAVLEIGPGYGVTTRWLAERAERLTAVEVDPELADALRADFGDAVDVRTADGADLPFPDGSFDAVVCFTMLHHVPSRQQQDRLFAEAARVLRPGGVLAGSDGRQSLRFRLIHVRDTLVPVDPATLPARLHTAGLTDADTALGRRTFRFRAIRPATSPT